MFNGPISPSNLRADARLADITEIVRTAKSLLFIVSGRKVVKFSAAVDHLPIGRMPNPSGIP